MIKPNAMEDSVQQLQGHFQSQPVPPPPQNINFQELAAKQIRELGPSMDPALSQLATVMATMQLKSEYEIKLSSHLLHKTLLETVNSVKQNSLDISDLKSSVWQTVQTCQQVQQQQGQSLSQLSQVHETSAPTSTSRLPPFFPGKSGHTATFSSSSSTCRRPRWTELKRSRAAPS